MKLIVVILAVVVGACDSASYVAQQPVAPTPAIASVPAPLPAADPPPTVIPVPPPPVAAPVPDNPVPPLPACIDRPITRANWAWKSASQVELQNTTCKAVTYTCALVDMADDRVYAKHTVTVDAGTRGYFSLNATICKGRKMQIDCHEGAQVEIRNPHFAAQIVYEGDADCSLPPPPPPVQPPSPPPPPPPVCGPDGRIPGSDKPCPK